MNFKFLLTVVISMFFSVFADDTPVGPNDTSAEVVPDDTAQTPAPEQVKQDEPTAEENTADQIVPQDTTATVQLQTQEEIKPSEPAAETTSALEQDKNKDKADKKEKKKKSAKVVKVESEYLQKLVKYAGESSKEIANLNAQISDMTIRGVIKNLEDINRFLIENYGDILKSVVIVVLPDGKTYVEKREVIEAALGFNLEEFEKANEEDIKEREEQQKNSSTQKKVEDESVKKESTEKKDETAAQVAK